MIKLNMRAPRTSRVLAAAVAVAIAAPVVAQDGLDEIIVTARKREENLQNVPMSISAITSKDLERLNLSTTADIADYDASLIFDEGYSATDTRIVMRGLSPTRGRTNVALLVDNVNVTSEAVSFAGGGMLATSRLMDLQRVEIVKGPQSVLYGRGAFAGAISYVTKDPGNTFEGEVRADFADYRSKEFGFAVGGPVTDTFGLRFNAVAWEEGGFYREFARGQRVGGGDGMGAALTGVFQPTDSFKARARIEYSDDHYDPAATVSLRHTGPGGYAVPRPQDGVDAGVYAPGTVIGVHGKMPDADGLQVSYSENPFGPGTWPGSDREVLRGSLTLEWQVPGGTLTSITGVTDAEFSFIEDGDFDAEFAPGAQFGMANDIATRAAIFDYSNKTKQLSQELRFQSDFDGPVNFAASALYWNDDVEQAGRSLNMFCLPEGAFGPGTPATCAGSANQQLPLVLERLPRAEGHEVEHISFGALIEWQATERLKFSAEARYSEEDETTIGQICDYAEYGPTCQDPSWPPMFGPFAIYGPSINFLLDPTQQGQGVAVELKSKSSYTTPRFSAEFQATDDLLLYASAAKGVKPGGISTIGGGAWSDADYDGSFEEITYGAETLWAYEVGTKINWLDGQLRTNLALFWQDYEGKQTGAQVITPSGIATGRILNAGSAEIKGAELGVTYAPTAHWLFGLNYAYTDGEFTDFSFLSNSATDAVRVGGVCNPVEVNGTPVCSMDLSGYSVEDVPEHAGVLTARYQNSLFGTGLGWFLEGDATAQSKRYIDQFNRRWLDSYALFNLRFGVTGDNWEALLYVDNVGDDDTIRSATDSPGDVDASLVSALNFSPADNVQVRLPDPRVVGLRLNYRFN